MADVATLHPRLSHLRFLRIAKNRSHVRISWADVDCVAVDVDALRIRVEGSFVRARGADGVGRGSLIDGCAAEVVKKAAATTEDRKGEVVGEVKMEVKGKARERRQDVETAIENCLGLSESLCRSCWICCTRRRGGGDGEEEVVVVVEGEMEREEVEDEAEVIAKL
jgi:hypothetical protein